MPDASDWTDGTDPDEDAMTGEPGRPEDSLGSSEIGIDDLADEDRESTSTLALFEGDEGRLDLAVRKALVVLLKNRFVAGRTHPKEWAVIAANTALIRSRLNDLFLELVASNEARVAYKRQVTPEGGGRFPTLLHDTVWGREETVLMIFLRARHRSERAAGAERVYVDRADIHEYVEQHRPGHATDVAGDRRRVTRAIEAIVKADLLIGASNADRFEISDAIEVLLPVPKLHALLDWLTSQTAAAGDDRAPAQGPHDETDERP